MVTSRKWLKAVTILFLQTVGNASYMHGMRATTIYVGGGGGAACDYTLSKHLRHFNA